MEKSLFSERSRRTHERWNQVKEREYCERGWQWNMTVAVACDGNGSGGGGSSTSGYGTNKTRALGSLGGCCGNKMEGPKICWTAFCSKFNFNLNDHLQSILDNVEQILGFSRLIPLTNWPLMHSPIPLT
ncbi:hypothetical protein ACH5RR_040969 [Cinchona calisaya]|uniref:Uncharacterized protein n=1 Tax=Cinchona calisaya TaxID=153742 RepID=A0ABD2XSP0_9GENT